MLFLIFLLLIISSFTCICATNCLDSPPSFDGELKNKKALRGDTLDLELVVLGFPKPSAVMWYKDSTLIQTDARTTFQYSEGKAKLQIYDASLEDSGMYTCHTENKHGNAICRIPVKVENVSTCI